MTLGDPQMLDVQCPLKTYNLNSDDDSIRNQNLPNKITYENPVITLINKPSLVIDTMLIYNYIND